MSTSSNNKKQKKAVRKIRYSMEEKIEVLRLLKENEYNIPVTAANTGVAINTIKDWVRRYKNELDSLTTVNAIAEEVELNVARVKNQFVNRHFNKLNTLAESAITRALELVTIEEDLSKVNNTIKIIGDFVLKLSQASGKAEETAQSSVNLIQQNIMMLNQIKDKE